jgi:hypothetical protein
MDPDSEGSDKDIEDLLIDSISSEVVSPEVLKQRARDVIKRALELSKVTKKREGSNGLKFLVDEMSNSEKVRAAVKGPADIRGLLIFDSEILVARAVLSNPQLTEKEIGIFLKNPQLSHFVIRDISDNKKWMAHYFIKKNMVLNPKTPCDISLKLLRQLMFGDLKMISKSKNLPAALVKTARRIVSLKLEMR